MSEDTPLTALCAICHVGEPRYTCPRCGIHTCSLPCVKLHKVRASCSGVRDPTAYRKRADLATASSIDSDFNFITSLERSLTRTDDSHADNDLQAAGLTRTRQTDSTRLDRLVKERGVTWRRAPKGMKRRQENETRVEHSGVTWTIEFMAPDGSRKLYSIPDKSTVSEALTSTTKATAPKHLGKRKRGSGRAGNEDPTPKKPAIEDAPTEPLSGVSTDGAGILAEHAPKQPKPAAESAPDAPITPPYADHHVYLLRPNTPSKLKVLKLLQPSDKLMDVLNGRTVMEFPTLYIKTEPPDALVAPFMSEEKYLEEFGEDVAPTAAAAAAAKSGAAGEESEEEGEVVDETAGKDLKQDAEEVLRVLADPSKVLSVLEQDLKSS